MISNLKKNGLKPEKIDKLKLSVVDGQIVNWSSDETGTITRQNMENLQNNKVPKTAVPAKYGNTKATVPVQQKAPTKKGKYD